jgi:hypothetical protein
LVAEKSWENEKETTKFTCNSKRDRVLSYAHARDKIKDARRWGVIFKL